MAVIALDVGERRIGIAVADPSGSFALPLEVLERNSLDADLTAIVSIAQTYGADTIVVGDPIQLSGQRGLAAEKMDRFVRALASRYEGSIERVDERLTTAQATRSLIAADVSRAKRKRVVDKLAAALILDTYLARQRAKR